MTDTKDPIVRIEGVTKSFGSFTALHEMNLSIASGEFVTFLGPSGCGKSTTLRILGGFERPDTGRVILNGQDVTALPPNKRNVNMVFQDYALFPNMTVRRNIAFGLELKGMGASAIAARISELASFLELTAYLDRRPDQLSGGQRQRVALARALAPDPALLLLDEPLGALDAKLRAQVQVELKAIQRRTNKTFFFVTHDQEEALTMSDRIVVMNKGRIEQDGTPEELYFRPASRFVAEFIGETNLLTGRALGLDQGSAGFDWQGHSLRAVAAPKGTTAAGATATASLRPEKVQVTRERPATENAVEGTVVSRLFKGHRMLLDVAVGDQVIQAYTDTDRGRDLADGKVWLGWNAANLTLLAD
ncbi:ABC transporter ATP-binding protein [Pseudorhodobacter sp. MZDSW-24AT]|uniref:ABC transporter ATP-binding protein n=1 Tax=Pseudorhodobacter sp. MZDSW-24AT TaxID=2052957 RepID=UPI000C1F1113|nr:ABC transporter ATP-binding protein [Pseudorhodobacter sp. MZDSW-24AT]PJF09210.1 spermidine/putrescine ABC transporter ATP-binding protein [Pseudorhodobacter sp. MZDSW-24AT]